MIQSLPFLILGNSVSTDASVLINEIGYNKQLLIIYNYDSFGS